MNGHSFINKDNYKSACPPFRGAGNNAPMGLIKPPAMPVDTDSQPEAGKGVGSN